MNTPWLIGLIWAVFCGWAVSSYASNFIFRLPRKEYPFGRKPYCDNCNALLQPKDLFPIFSYLLTDGKCRYCGSGVPMSYYLAELVYPLLFIVLYINYDFGDMFLLTALAFTALLVLVMAAYESGYYSPMTLLFVAVLGMLTQVLTLGTLTPLIIGAFSCFVFAVAWHRWRNKTKDEIDLRTLPPYVWMTGVLGCWLPLPAALLVVGLWVMLWAILRMLWHPQHPLVLTVMSFAVSLTAVALYWY